MVADASNMKIKLIIINNAQNAGLHKVLRRLVDLKRACLRTIGGRKDIKELD